MAPSRFVVGIDLGTTHTVAAWAALEDASATPRVLDLPQLVSAGAVAERPLLPSLLYAPLEGERMVDPWGEPACAQSWVKGEVARRRGLEVPGRLVTSAKSWLCHAGVDRTAPILPWGVEAAAGDGDAGPPRISPCDASAAYLAHVRRVWDAAHPDDPLADQEVVVTVPASFDQAARELTLRAARIAGLAPRLLEEPQAVVYDYRSRNGDAPFEALLRRADGDVTVLVVDVGGGTTDLSLLRVARSASPGDRLDVTRVAVGRHLLLGGDNMDLALAHACERRLAEAPLEPSRFGQLVHAARVAKEALLAARAPDEVTVTVAGAGARLVGGTLSTRLGRLDAEALLLDGFFPIAPPSEAAPRVRSGLLGFGLPYEQDVAITRHLAAFFRRHGEGAPAPRALLLNGGVFHAPAIVARVAQAVDAWGGPPVVVLPHADPDLAVARGAVAYGLARRGVGPTIAGGAARGYYVAVESAAGAARSVVCVVPRGAGEGDVHVAGGLPLALVTGRPARFELFASDNARGHRAGDVVALDGVDLDPLPPVHASFGDASVAGEEVRVALQGELSAIGTLDLACVELSPASPPARRFELAFDLRGAPDRAIRASQAAPAPRGGGIDARASRPFAEAVVAVERVFGKAARDVTPREVKDLVRELERVLGERGGWDAATTRALFDAILPLHKGRRRSADHERVFWQLAGYCLRPGTGDAGDPPRVRGLAQLLPDRLAFADEVRGWQQFWFAWRRVAGGLDASTQLALRDLVDPVLAPREAGKKAPKGWRTAALESVDAVLETASSLERVPASRRAELGAWILERTWTDRDPRLWAALGRLGARIPVYASTSHVVSPGTVERWVDHLLREKWAEVPTAVEAAVRMARVSGDRARDLPERVRREVARRLAQAGLGDEAVRPVIELVTLGDEATEQAALLGEGLPVGLRLLPAGTTDLTDTPD